MPLANHFIIAAGVSDDPTLPNVKRDLEKIVDYFTGFLGYEQALSWLAASPTVETFRRSLSDWFASSARTSKDRVVLYFSGHGDIADDRAHYLSLADTIEGRLEGTGFETSKLASIPFEPRRVRLLLVILDTCYSAAGVASAVSLASEMHPDAECLLQLISCTRKRELAIDGVFAPAFLEAIRNSIAANGRRVQEYLGVDSILAALEGRLPKSQIATWQFAPSQAGPVLSPIRNPHFDARVPLGLDLEEQEYYQRDLATHFLPRAQGGDVVVPDSNIGYFTGRRKALREISAWLNDRPPFARLLVVTGRPGAGKSAVLGRLITLADPELRRNILSADPASEDGLPPERVFDTALHVRGLGIREIAGIVASALGFERLDPELRDDKIGAALAQAFVKHDQPYCLAFDALDEAIRPGEMWRDLFLPLCDVTNLWLLVGSRQIFDWGTTRLIDLSDPRYLGETDIQDYVELRLLAAPEPRKWSPYRNQTELAKKVAKAVAARAGGVFLVASIVSRSLVRAEIQIDTAIDGWQQSIPHSLRGAFEQYLEQFGDLNDKVRDVLVPLAFAEGLGLPWEQIWAALASALSGRAYGDSDVREVIEKAGPFIVESQDAGRSVYRLYHQELIDYFRVGERGRTTAIHSTFVEVLQRSIPRNGRGSADFPRSHPYVLRHFASHAAKGERLDEFMTEAAFLSSVEPSGLIPWLRRVEREPARQWRNCYQIASHLLSNLEWTERASIMERVAREQGLDSIGNEFANLGGTRKWRVPWSSWQPAAPHTTIRGHDAEISALAVTRAGPRYLIISGSADNTIRKWDLETGERIGEPLRGHEAAITSLTVTPPGQRRLIISGSVDKTVRLWDLETGQAVGGPLRGHFSTVTAVAVTKEENQRRILSGSQDSTVRVWDLETGKMIGEPLLIGSDHVTVVIEAEYRNRRAILSGCRNGEMWAWDLQSREVLGNTRTPGSVIGIFEVTAPGYRELLALETDWKNVLRVWDVEAAARSGVPIVGHTGTISTAAIMEYASRSLIVTGSRDYTLRVWDRETSEQIGQPLIGHAGQVTALEVMPRADWPVIVSGGSDKTIRVWNLEKETSTAQLLRRHKSDVKAVAVSCDDKPGVVVTGSEDATIRTWDLETGAALGEPFCGHERDVNGVAITQSQGMQIIVSVGFGEGGLRLWNLQTGEAIGKPLDDHLLLESVAVGQLHGRELIITGSQLSNLRIWDLSTRIPVGDPLEGHNSIVYSVVITERRGRPVIVSGSSDGTIRLWDLDTRKPVAASPLPLRRYQDWILAVAVTNEGPSLGISGCNDGTVRIWNVDSGEWLGEPLTGHNGFVSAVASTMHGDQRLIISGSWDNTLRIWSWPSRRCLQVIDLDSPVRTVVARGDWIVAGCRRGLIRINLGRL
jgi:WD40 repeat protein